MAVIGDKRKIGCVAPARDFGWQGEASLILTPDHKVAVIATALLHQGCSVSVRYCQVVVRTVGVILYVE